MFFFSVLVSCLLAVRASARDSAWNGQAPPDSKAVIPFRPYYVPQGTTSYDSSSPYVHYHGKWHVLYSHSYVQNSLHKTRQPGAYLTFTFIGTGIEWFGNLDDAHGLADVFINGEFYERVDAWRDWPRQKPMKQQRVWWKYDLPCGRHKVKIANVGKHTYVVEKSEGATTYMDVDAFVVTHLNGCGYGRRYDEYIGQEGRRRHGHIFYVDEGEGRPTTTTLAATGMATPPAGADLSSGPGQKRGLGLHHLHSEVQQKRPHSLVKSIGTNSTSLGPRDVDPVGSRWTLKQLGSTGVAAMQLVVISETHALVIDKVEHNPLTLSGRPAWAALYDLGSHAVRPLRMYSNSFCAGGTFLGNGTLINVGGNPVVESKTNAADFGDVDGMQAIRIFEPCNLDTASGCRIYENQKRIRLASPRWYNTVVRLDDGSALIVGGSKKGGWINNATVNNPTIEFFPAKGVHKSKGMPIYLQFLVDTLGANLFPIVFLLPNGHIFMAANRDAMIYDRFTNTEKRLPRIPNGVRVTYPMAGTAVLLPLVPEKKYDPEVLICGGSTIDDQKPGYEISSQDPASSQCVRILLTDEGIQEGWQVENMPQGRTMSDAVLLPTGDVVIVNGAGAGISGYGNVKGQIGSSNADRPIMTPLLYSPHFPAGHRFSQVGMPATRIPRMYHSVATLTPSGAIMIAGSNPNLDRSEIRYGTEYRVEWLSPPYMQMERPEIVRRIRMVAYNEIFGLHIQAKEVVGEIKVSLMDLGFVTHANHANSRLVYLKAILRGNRLIVTGPPTPSIYPPGPAFLYVVINGVPSEGIRVIVGNGEDPPIDKEATEYMLRHTKHGHH